MAVTTTRAIATIVRERAGIVLGEEKAYLIESRLAPVARRFGFDGVASMSGALGRTASEPLLAAITEALTTNETSFFRDGRPFEQFSGVVLPRLLRQRVAERRLKIWSAAASTGQEAYSLAICLDEVTPPLDDWTISILGTDLSQAALARARAGRYSPFEVQRGLDPARLARHFEKDGDTWLIREPLRRRVAFAAHNLLHDCRTLGRFDVIFLRNVLIYFDLPTRQRIFDNIATMLPDDGFLFLGGTETVLGVTDALVALPEARGVFRPTSRSKVAAHCDTGVTETLACSNGGRVRSVYTSQR